MKKYLLGIIGLAVLIGVWYVVTYNSLVTKRQAVRSSWGQVQNVYQRRADLIPNLVEVVKGYAKHENETLTKVAEARQQIQKIDVSGLVSNPEVQKQFLDAQKQLSGALSRLLVVSEAYPDLKANSNFLQLQAQLEGTENRIAVARRDNQLAVENYNNSVQSLISGIVAKIGNFKEEAYFQADQAAQSAPQVKF